jgi:hypothetical protein
VKHKIESQNEVKAKEQEEKEVIAQQVICLAILLPANNLPFLSPLHPSLLSN